MSNLDWVDEILVGLLNHHDVVPEALCKSVNCFREHIDEPTMKEASQAIKQKLTNELVRAKKEQIMQDFMSLEVLSEGFDIDEAILIDWRENQLKELKEQL